jgi:hypothetical protein
MWVFKASNLLHSHLIESTSFRALNSLSHEDREQIKTLAGQGMSSAAIHNAMNFIIAPSVLQDIIHPVRRGIVSQEATELAQMANQWEHFTTLLVTDPDHNFGGFYAANITLGETSIFRETLIMDDTACTNHFDLAVFAVIGIDEHGRNQLLGVGILMKRTAGQFANFLRWLQTTRTPPGERPLQPKAIVVDRLAGQF